MSTPKRNAGAGTGSLMVRGLSPECEKMLKELEPRFTSKNRAVRILLNGIAKDADLIQELLDENGASSRLRRFSDLLPALAWGDHVFQERKSLEVIDFYSLIIQNSEYQGFPGILQLAKHRCGFASLDVALDFENRGLKDKNKDELGIACDYVCLAIGFFKDYLDNARAKKDAWQTGVAYYDLACCYAQRARHQAYILTLDQLGDLANTDIDHVGLWKPGSATLKWRKSEEAETKLSIIKSANNSIDCLKRMAASMSDHLASLVADTASDPDFIFLKADQDYSQMYKHWFELNQGDEQSSDNLTNATKTMLDNIRKRFPVVEYGFKTR